MFFFSFSPEILQHLFWNLVQKFTHNDCEYGTDLDSPVFKDNLSVILSRVENKCSLPKLLTTIQNNDYWGFTSGSLCLVYSLLFKELIHLMPFIEMQIVFKIAI